MDLGIRGRRALVTGAGRGIGRAIARSLAAEGVRVAVCSRTAGDVESLVEEMGGTTAGHWAQAIDLIPEGAPGSLVEEIGRTFGMPDVIVHNAGGTLGVTDPLCSIDDWRKVWRFNFEIAVELNRLLVPAMQQRRWGRIVHVASIAAAENQGPVTYCSAKAALTAYARSFGRVLAPDGIIVTAVLPGAVFTQRGYWDDASIHRPEHVKRFIAERMAIGRFGRTDEISDLVTFLCSNQASFCVGSIVPVDGGQGRTFFGGVE